MLRALHVGVTLSYLKPGEGIKVSSDELSQTQGWCLALYYFNQSTNLERGSINPYSLSVGLPISGQT